MDVDIEDILAELDRDTTAVNRSDPRSDALTETGTAVNSSFPQAGKGGDNVATSEDDFVRLSAAWRNERCAPELLQYPHALMGRMLARIQAQMEHLEMLSMDFMGGGSTAVQEMAPGGNRPVNNNKMLPLLCMEAELERIKFVIRSYIRCRLAKIDKYSLYLRQVGEQKDEDGFAPLDAMMSRDELTYYQRHAEITLKLFNDTILKHLPPDLQAINDTEGAFNMVDEPDWAKFVFVKVTGPSDGKLDADHQLTRDADGNYFYQTTIQELDEEIDLSIGSIYVLRYNVIKDLLIDGKVVLI